MSFELAISLVLAGFIYIVTPGPVFLAIIGHVAERGASYGFRFIFGAIFGCMIWLSLTFTSLIEADRLPAIVFIMLGICCSAYLFYLGSVLILRSGQDLSAKIFKKPVRDGFLLATLNPKSYPVMISLISSIVLHNTYLVNWTYFPYLFSLMVLGFVLGYFLCFWFRVFLGCEARTLSMRDTLEFVLG